MRRYSFPRGALSPLEAAILALIRDCPRHTLALHHALQPLVGKVSHQSLYVFVQRLRDEGLLRTAWAPSGQPREHRLTPKGARRLERALAWWDRLR